MRTALRSCLCVLAILALVSPAAFAGGKRDAPLDEARELLEQKNLSQAMASAILTFREDPETLDIVLLQLDAILSQSAEVNRLLRQATEIDISTEEGIREARQVLARAQALEQSPNPELATNLARAQARLLLENTRHQYAAFMDGILPLVREGRYLDAAVAYLDGFDKIAWQEFEEIDYTFLLSGTPYANLREVTLGSLEDIRGAVRSAARLGPALDGALGQVLGAIDAADTADLTAAVPRLTVELDELDRQRDRVVALGTRIGDLYASLYRDLDIPEYYLYFALQIVTGRKSVPGAAGQVAIREGIYQVLELDWETRVEQVATGLEEAAAGQLAAMTRAQTTGAYTAMERAASLARVYSVQANAVVRSWATQFRMDATYRPTDKGLRLIDANLPRLVLNQERAKEAALYLDLGREVAYLDTTTTLGQSAGLQRLEEARLGVDTRRNSLRALSAGWRGVVERYDALQSAGLGSTQASERARAAAEVVTQAIARMDREDTRLAESQAGLQLAEHQTVYDALARRRELGVAQIAGIGTTAGGAERVEVLPFRGRELLAQVRNELLALREKLGSYAVVWQAQPAHVRSSRAIAGYLSRVGELDAAIERDQSIIARQITTAEEKLRLAADRKATGAQRFEQARRDLANNDFEAASTSLTRASSAYIESLGYSEDGEVRRLVDVELVAFADRIQETQQALVIADVRRLLTEGRAAQEAGEYLAANDLYTRAQARHADYFVVPDGEVEQAIRNIRSILTFESQREITVTNPIYDVVSQLYNNARAAYDAAVAYQRRGLRVDETRSLAQAKEIIARMRDIVPFYKDMRLLDLRVLQLEDPVRFRSNFDRLYQEAVANLQPGGSAQDALASLEDLQQIDPAYRGIEGSIYDAKVALGLIKPPPRAEDRATSQGLTEQARALYARPRATDADYAQALDMLNRAIDMWSGNEDAYRLKDIVTGLRTSGRRELVLRSESEQRYQQARELFGRLDYFGAKRVIDQLIETDPVARNYLPLLELQRRVEQETS